MLATCAAACLALLGPGAKSQAYVWKSVQLVGGGFVDGIVFHPKAKDVVYARTDIGGAYRWDPAKRRWTPILDWLGYKDVNLMGVESIGLDPTDPNRLYLACGMYTNNSSPNAAILCSTDRGVHFQRSDLPFKMGGNENGRGNGERLAVDPNSPNVLFFGSRLDGLWWSGDYGKSWSQVNSFPLPIFPDGPRPRFGIAPGIVSVVFDPSRGSKTIYAAESIANQPNLFRSRDGGATWQPIAGEPTDFRPTRMVLAKDGKLSITYGTSAGPSPMRAGAVWQVDTHTDTWTNISPEDGHFGYAAVSVQADDPKVMVVSSFYHPNGEEIFRSLDEGHTWKPVMRSAATYDFSLAPYVSKTPIHWLFDLEIDPFNPNHAIFTTGYGGYETFNLSDLDRGKPVKWQVMSTGIEETVALQLLSPRLGRAHLITAIGDYGGFVDWDLDKPSPEGNFENPRFGNTTGLAGAADNPLIVVRSGSKAGTRSTSTFGYSLDGGKSWSPSAASPLANSNSGHIAVSANGLIWIWTPARSVPYWTDDLGATWHACQGLHTDSRVIADPFDSLDFYSLDLFAGTLFVSTDGGGTFQVQKLELPGGLPKREGNRGDDRGGQDQLYATPGREGDLWVAAFNGLYHAPSLSQPFVRLPGVEELHAFGFGKAAPGSNDPALYLAGVVEGVRGVYRSDDFGGTWTRINDDQHQWGLILQVAGDPRIYGRVYVGTHGRGVVYGDPRPKEQDTFYEPDTDLYWLPVGHPPHGGGHK